MSFIVHQRIGGQGSPGEMSLPMALQELGKARKVVLRDCQEVLAELARKQREIIGKPNLKLET